MTAAINANENLPTNVYRRQRAAAAANDDEDDSLCAIGYKIWRNVLKFLFSYVLQFYTRATPNILTNSFYGFERCAIHRLSSPMLTCKMLSSESFEANTHGNWTAAHAPHIHIHCVNEKLLHTQWQWHRRRIRVPEGAMAQVIAQRRNNVVVAPLTSNTQRCITTNAMLDSSLLRLFCRMIPNSTCAVCRCARIGNRYTGKPNRLPSSPSLPLVASETSRVCMCFCVQTFDGTHDMRVERYDGDAAFIKYPLIDASRCVRLSVPRMRVVCAPHKKFYKICMLMPSLGCDKI